ncbi:MAG: T9SS type A sorting domain-containing protein [Flavobacteriales bacterium]|nr:T9SS type A sorting domain-containing protein [Flavobacteriales bacterium]
MVRKTSALSCALLIAMFVASAQEPCSCWVEPDASYTLLENTTDWNAVLGVNNADDGAHGAVYLPFPYQFFGLPEDSLFISVNGYITFRIASTAWGWDIPHAGPLRFVAPFFADVDLSALCATCNKVYYKIGPSSIRINWVRVGYFQNHLDKQNTFQLTLTDGNDPSLPVGTNTAFCYRDMQWATGDAGQGVGGFGTGTADVGADTGDMNHYLSVGQFNQDSEAFDGPGGDPDGVHRLDSASIYLDLSQLTTDPPYAFIGGDCEVVVPGLWLGSSPEHDVAVSTYPNPTVGNMQVVLSGSHRLETIDLLTLDGRLIKSFVIKPGQQRFDISLDDLAPGPYQLRISGPGGPKTSLIVRAL